MPVYERELLLSRAGERSGYILIAITFDRQYVAVYDKASAGSGVLLLPYEGEASRNTSPRHLAWFGRHTEGLSFNEETGKLEVTVDLSTYPVIGGRERLTIYGDLDTQISMTYRDSVRKMKDIYAGIEDKVGAFLVITENEGNLYKGLIIYNGIGINWMNEFSFHGNSNSSIEWYRACNSSLSPFADIPSNVRLFPGEFANELSTSIHDTVRSYHDIHRDYTLNVAGVNFKLPKDYRCTIDSNAVFEYEPPKREPYIEPEADLSVVSEWVKSLNEKFGCKLAFNSELGVLYNEADYLSELAQGEAETTVTLWVNDGKKRVTVAEPNLSVGEAQEKFNLTIPEGVRAIGAGAFIFLRNRVSKLYLPDSLVEVGVNTFFGCGIEDVSFGCSLVSIGAGAFAYNCFSNVALPPSLVEVGMGCFTGNDLLSSLEIYRTGLRLVLRSAVENLKDAERYSVASGKSATVKVSSQVISLTGTKHPKVFREEYYNYLDRDIDVVSEIASIELCRKLGWYTCALTTAQVLAREVAKERKAWSKYTGASKQGTTVAYLKSLLATLAGAEE